MKIKKDQITALNLPQPQISDHLKRRLVCASRLQMEMQYTCLDDLIDDDHQAKHIWNYVERLGPISCLLKIKSVEGTAGRPAIDPKILIAIWLYATVLGIGSAWALADYCRDHNGFKWICGGVSIDRKTLSNFRTLNIDVFNELLAKGVALLVHAGLVNLEEIAQDGLKVRASAGKSSFRRKKTLKIHLEEAKSRVNFLQEELEKDPFGNKERIKTTKAKRAKEKVERLERAIKELEEYADEKDQNRKKYKKKALTPEEKKQLRASSTDPEARNMKMPDGGFRPAYNVQFAVDTHKQVIVGVDVSKKGTDGSEMEPMFQQIQNLYNKTPSRYLVDGGFKNQLAIKNLYNENCLVFMPSENAKGSKTKKISKQNKDLAVQEWQTRMKTEEARKTYKNRASTVECTNAQARFRGLYQFLVRGLNKVKGIAVLFAVTHNMIRTLSLGI